jgi:NADH-quinone oxidoreductase subunit H
MSFNLIDFLRSLVQLTVFDYLRAVWADSMAPWLIEAILDIAGILIVSSFLLLIVIFLIWLERKIIARIQDRIGPNRVGGRFGLLQTVADVIKLLVKEQITPAGADFLAYNLAPLLTVMTSLLLWAVIPFADGIIGVDLNIGVFYILSISSASVVTILLAGWGSNNKYALLGAFRSVAQLVSYEIPMVLSLIVPILLAHTMALQGLVLAQIVPYLLVVPLSAIIFFISALAETGRTPFDLLEAESEIVAGFHIEYSGMKFGMFFLAEFISTLFMSALFATIYLGGWRFFGLESLETWGRPIGFIAFFVKMFAVYFVFVWIRGTLPRVRIDQMMDLNWKFLVPLSLVLVLVVAIVEKLSFVTNSGPYLHAAIHLVLNLAVGLGALEILRWRGRRERTAYESARELEGLESDELVAEAAH